MNEAEFLKCNHSDIIRIERFESLNPYKTEIGDLSETALDGYKFDYTIPQQNNQDKPSFYRAIGRILKDVKDK